MFISKEKTDNKLMGLIVFFTGAAGYAIIEYLFRGYTHWSMILTGGACLLAFYYYAKERKQDSIIVKAAIGSCIFTIFEFFVGLQVNILYGWHVWDYTKQPGNILGQICPMFSLVWFMMCIVILVIAENLCTLYRALRDMI